MIRVKATREGLVGKPTASGYIIETSVPFVALPSTRALYHAAWLRNPLNGRQCWAVVLDVGPWNTHDDYYVFGSARPQAETGFDLTGRPTNFAGIDLGEWVWKRLDMKDNGLVDWSFAIAPTGDGHATT